MPALGASWKRSKAAKAYLLISITALTLQQDARRLPYLGSRLCRLNWPERVLTPRGRNDECREIRRRMLGRQLGEEVLLR